MILLIETSHRMCSVAVCDTDGNTVWSAQDERVLKHAETLPVLVDQAVQSFENIKAIGLSKGPGSYTGLRIGASLSQGLCYAKDWPLLAIPTHLGLIDFAIQNMGDLDYVALVHAGRNEAYMAQWTQSKLSKVTPQHLTEEWIDSLDSHINFVGDCMDILPGSVASERKLDRIPHADLLAPAAARKWKAQDFEDLAYFTPLYAKDFIPGVSKKFNV